MESRGSTDLRNLIDVCTSNINNFKKTNVEILTTTINVGSEKVSKAQWNGAFLPAGFVRRSVIYA